jgi:gluconate kinase
MVIGIFGASCTGKSSIAEEIAKRTNAKIFTGKDYMKIAKSEAEAKKQFIDMLNSDVTGSQSIIYVITEKEQLTFLPEKAIRIYMTADIDTIKARFAKRMNGILPPQVVAMLEKMHTLFNDEKYDLMIKNVDRNISDICDTILEKCAK